MTHTSESARTLTQPDLVWPTQNTNLKSIKLDRKIYNQARPPLMITMPDNQDGKLNYRQVKAGKKSKLSIKFDDKLEDAREQDKAYPFYKHPMF